MYFDIPCGLSPTLSRGSSAGAPGWVAVQQRSTATPATQAHCLRSSQGVSPAQEASTTTMPIVRDEEVVGPSVAVSRPVVAGSLSGTHPASAAILWPRWAGPSE